MICHKEAYTCIHRNGAWLTTASLFLSYYFCVFTITTYDRGMLFCPLQFCSVELTITGLVPFSIVSFQKVLKAYTFIFEHATFQVHRNAVYGLKLKDISRQCRLYPAHSSTLILSRILKMFRFILLTKETFCAVDWILFCNGLGLAYKFKGFSRHFRLPDGQTAKKRDKIEDKKIG